MRILITGGAGLVGSHCAEFFAQRGDTVIVLDNLIRSKLLGYDKKTVEYNWDYLKTLQNVSCILGDIRKKEDLDKAIGEGVDAVIHTAGQPAVPLSIENPLEDFSINAFGSFNVLEAVRHRCPKVKIVYCSTNKVFGENVDRIKLIEEESRYAFKDRIGVNEKMPTDITGHTPYGVSKLVGDLYSQEYARLYGMTVGVFRMSCIYGTRQFGFEEQGWVAWFIIAALINKPITIYGNGKQVRDLLYVEDLVEAFRVFIDTDIKSNVFCIGGGKENSISLLEFIDRIQSITGIRLNHQFRDWRKSDQKVYISDTQKAKKVLKWEAKIGIEEGIKKVLNWVNENKTIFS